MTSGLCGEMVQQPAVAPHLEADMKNRLPGVRLLLAAGLAIVLTTGLLRWVGAGDPLVLRSVAVGLSPGLAVVDAPHGQIFVPNTNGGTVSVLDTRDGRLLRTIGVGIQSGSHVYNAVADGASGHVFFRTGDDVLSMLDVASGVVKWATALSPCSRGLALDSRLAHVFVAECQNGTMQMIDARSGRILTNIKVGGQPQEIAVDEQTRRVFEMDGSGSRLSLLDSAHGRMLRTFTLGAELCLCITTPLHGGPVFVLDGKQSQVYVLDATSARLLRTVPIGMDVSDHDVDAQTGTIFLAGAPHGTSGGAASFSGPGRLVVLDGRSGRVLRRLDLRASPLSVALDASGRYLLLSFIGPTDSGGRPVGAGYVEVLDAHSLRVLRTIQVGIVPWQIAVDPRTDHAFVINANIVPGSSDPTGNTPTYIPQPEGWWEASTSRVKRLLPWLPISMPRPDQSVNGTVTVLDLTRM